jgi:hypothetical protein
MAPVVKPAVPTPNAHYPGQQHEQMKAQVTQNYSPDTATAVSDAWKSLGKSFQELATDFTILVNGSQSAWTGKAAEGVRTALSKVGTFAESTGDGFVRTSTAVAQQRDAAVQANRSMPEPVKFSPMDSLKKFAVPAVIFPPAMVGAPFDMMAQHNAQQEAKAEAVQVMQTRDSTMMAAAMSMPTMESTPQVTQDQGVTQTSSSTSSQSLNNVNSSQRFSNNSAGMPSSSSNGTTNPAWVAPQVKDPSLQQPGGNNNQTNPGGQNRPPFTPPGMLPPGTRPPGGGQGRPPGGGPGMRPGGPGGGASGGRGMGPGGAGGGRGMGPGSVGGLGGGSGRGMGSFGPATPGGSAGVAGAAGGLGGAAGAGAAGRGAAGAGGMGAGGGAGAGKGGEEDKEHKSNYLVPSDEFFDDDRMVAPPVIGG